MEKTIILSDITPKQIKEQLLTIDEVAYILRVTTTTVTRWIKKGTIKPIKIGDSIRFSKYQILKLL